MISNDGSAGSSHLRRLFTVWVPSLLIAVYAGSVTALAAAAFSWAVSGLAHGSRIVFFALFSFGVLGSLRVAWWIFRRALAAERALADLYARMRPNRPAGSDASDPQP